MVSVKVVSVFSRKVGKGNPAGVVLDADNLDTDSMLKISKKLGFSESVFISNSKIADFKFRFFSPTTEVDICAHALIGGVHVLFDEKITKSNNLKIETKSGVLPVEIHQDGLIMMTQKNPEFLHIENDKNQIALLLNIKENEISDNPIQVVSTGTPKLIIPIKSLKILSKIIPDLEGIKQYCINNKVKGFYPFTFETKEKSDFHTRQFNPLAGINEDPATGIAAGALAAYIIKNKISTKKKFVIEQGYIMNKPSKIIVDAKKEIKVGGYATIIKQVDI